MTFPRREREGCFAVTFPSLQCAATRSFFADFSVWCLSLGTTHRAGCGELPRAPPDPPEVGGVGGGLPLEPVGGGLPLEPVEPSALGM